MRDDGIIFDALAALSEMVGPLPISDDPGFSRPTTKKPRGRPIARHTLAIRDAIDGLTFEQKQMTVRGVFYALTVRGIVDKSEAGYRQVQRQAPAGSRPRRSSRS